jgi:hypothetical protein
MTSQKSGTEELEQQVEQTRGQLAGAVEELVARTDVKQHLKTKAMAMRRKAVELSRRRAVQAGAGVFTAGMAAVSVLLHRRRS